MPLRSDAGWCLCVLRLNGKGTSPADSFCKEGRITNAGTDRQDMRTESRSYFSLLLFLFDHEKQLSQRPIEYNTAATRLFFFFFCRAYKLVALARERDEMKSVNSRERERRKGRKRKRGGGGGGRGP